MRRRATSIALVLLAICVAGAMLAGSAPRVLGAGGPADLVLLNGKIGTVDPSIESNRSSRC